MAARGYFPARRERGSVHTEDAAGRHRRRAIESSVVKAPVKAGNREVASDGAESCESSGKLRRARLLESHPGNGP